MTRPEPTQHIDFISLSLQKVMRRTRSIVKALYRRFTVICVAALVFFTIAQYAVAAFAIFTTTSSRVVPKIHLLCIGIDRYSNINIDSLRFAKTDAERVQAAFKGLVPRTNIVSNVLLEDASATKENILSKAREMASGLSDSDLFIIYFAGYGAVSPLQQDAYLLPVDVVAPALLTSADRALTTTAISINQDLAPLAGSNKKILLLADASHIGGGLLGNLAIRYPGFSIISPTRGDEVEIEDKRFSGSPFANAIVASLQGVTDYDGNGLISVDEWYVSLYLKTMEFFRSAGLKATVHPAMSGQMAHRMIISQAPAPPAGQEFKVDGALATLPAGNTNVKINGSSVTVIVDHDRSVLSLGKTDYNLFRQGLNVIETANRRLVYWREENNLFEFSSPYKLSYAIIVAIDDYDRTRDIEKRGPTGFHQLTGMVERADELADVLTQIGFSKEHVIKLYDAEATSDKIENALKDFWKGASHSDADRLFVYFGGHGGGYPGGVRLITYNYDPTRPSLTTFDARERPESQSRNIVAHHILYALDVCQAGLAIYRHLGQEQLSSREFERLSVIRANVEPVARNILVAGTEEEDALWDNGGIFTQALIRGLRGSADLSKTGVITFDDLKSYVRTQVIAKAAQTGIAQDPTGRILTEYGSGEVVFIPPE